MNTESFFEKANCRGYHGKDSSKFSGRCNYLSDSSLGAVGKKQVQQPAEIMNIVGRYCPGKALINVNFLKKGIDQNFYYCIISWLSENFLLFRTSPRQFLTQILMCIADMVA